MDVDGEHFVPVPLGEVLRDSQRAHQYVGAIMRLGSNTAPGLRYQKLVQLYHEESRDHPKAAVVLFLMLGYRVTPSYTVHAKHTHSLKWLVEDILQLKGAAAEDTRMLLLSRAGFRTYEDILVRTEEEARIAWNFTYGVIRPIAEIERIIINEALSRMGLINGLYRWAKGLRVAAQVAKLLNPFYQLIRMTSQLSGARFVLKLAQPPLELAVTTILHAASIVDSLETTVKVLDQLLVAYHALSDLSDFQASIHKNGGILLGTWKEFVDPIEKAFIDEIVDFFGDEVEDYG